MDARNRLLAKKEEIEQILKSKQEDFARPITESINDLSMYDQHPADIGSEMYEREKDAGMLELYELELEKINDAIQKYNQGKYGVCDECGQPIERRRLETLVNTTLCSNCARSKRDKFIRPAEEDISSIENMSDKGETFQVAGFEFYEHE